MWQVRVTDVDDKSNWSCSASFKLVDLEDVAAGGEADWQAGVTIVSPEEGDMAYAGETYTVLVGEVKIQYVFNESLHVGYCVLVHHPT